MGDRERGWDFLKLLLDEDARSGETPTVTEFGKHFLSSFFSLRFENNIVSSCWRRGFETASWLFFVEENVLSIFSHQIEIEQLILSILLVQKSKRVVCYMEPIVPPERIFSTSAIESKEKLRNVFWWESSDMDVDTHCQRVWQGPARFRSYAFPMLLMWKLLAWAKHSFRANWRKSIGNRVLCCGMKWE